MKELVVTLLAWAVVTVFGWLGTSGIIWLIFKCFDLQFSWKLATGFGYY